MKRYLFPFFVLVVSLACGQIITPTPNALGTVTPVIPTGTPLPTATPNALVDPLGGDFMVCKTEALNLRAFPGYEFPKVASPIERDTSVYVYVADVESVDGGRWSFILYGGIGYWVNATYLCEVN